MSHTIYAAKFEQTIIHQHVHLRRKSQSRACANEITVKPCFIAPPPTESSPNSHITMKLSSPVFFPCKKPRYNAKLAYRHPPRCQKIKWSIYC